MAGFVRYLFGKSSTDDIEKTNEQQSIVGVSGIYKEDITLPKNSGGKLAFVLHNVYTKEECDEFIRATEEKGYEPALLNIGAGRQQLMTDIRNSQRCIWDSEEQAEEMYRRIKPYIPRSFHGCTAVGLNERLRFLRYDPGEYFKPHMDGTFQRKNGERSYITVHLYLNEGFKGGSTTFLTNYDNNKDDVECVPKIGSILVFQHDILHEGSELVKGRKYTVRTDVMYRK